MEPTGEEMRRLVLQARHHHVVLGVPPTATRQQIRAAAKLVTAFIQTYDIPHEDDFRARAAKSRALVRIEESRIHMEAKAQTGRARPPSVTFNAIHLRNSRKAQMRKQRDRELEKWFEPELA